uniref:hypothetical protein n=1 Tax=Paraburkholderia terrae TaxID=311230 RepID=UPI00296B41EA
ALRGFLRSRCSNSASSTHLTSLTRPPTSPSAEKIEFPHGLGRDKSLHALEKYTELKSTLVRLR